MTISPFEALLSMSGEYDLFLDIKAWPKLLFENNLTPPVILADDVPIWGFSLMRQARDIGIPELPCMRISPAEKKDLLYIAIALENRAGSYSWEERKNILEFCLINNIAVDDAIIQTIEAGRFTDWQKKTEKYIGFPDSLKKLVQSRMLDIKSAEKIVSLPEPCIALVYEKKEKLTHSERRIFLEQLHEVMQRDGLAEKETSALCRTMLDAPDPVKLLEAARYPNLSSMQKEFLQHAQLLRKQGIALSAPDNFEGEAFFIRFPFVSRQNFNKKVNALQAFENHIDELFTLL
ncbi:MAG: hypothetical protein JW904_03090 [Spirochaetales bacterium]|nr:hypothetical protein [Spirochaetales bacterium]